MDSSSQPRKVFGIGLARTGTTTLAAVMERLGFAVKHLPLSWAEIAAVQFANDTTITARLPELRARYPDALYICTTRELAAWSASMRKWLGQTEARAAWYRQLSQAQRRWVDESDERIYGRSTLTLNSLDDEQLRAVYQRHHAAVDVLFDGNPEALLRLNVSDSTSRPLTALTAFLEKHGVLQMPVLNALPDRTEVQERAEAQPAAELRTELAQRAANEYFMAAIWDKREQPGRAMQGYRSCLALEPGHLQARIDLLDHLVRFERYAEARALAEVGVAIHPNSAELHHGLITAIVALDGFEAAYARYALTRVQQDPLDVQPGDIICCVVVRNEGPRLPHFLDYYRALGVDRFFIVDNGSTDESRSFLLAQDDVVLWHSDYSFNAANFGSVWFDLLLRRYASGNWCLTLDADELLVYPGCEQRPLRSLCAELENAGKTALGAALLDMYSDRAVQETYYRPGASFIATCPYFDRRWYHSEFPNGSPYGNQPAFFGGVRQRVFGERAKVYLNKIPLFRYDTDCILAGGQHWTNRAADQIQDRGGMVLHFKFFATFPAYVQEQVTRGEHYGNAYQYRHYAAGLAQSQELVLFDAAHSIRYENSRQLIRLGMMQPVLAQDTLRPAHAPAIAPAVCASARPFWSVFVTVHTRVQHLAQALQSVVGQAGCTEDMEVFVLQDGDVAPAITDAIAEITARVAGDRVTLRVLPQRLGHPIIFNECIRMARGEWIHILHDDDWVDSGFYETLRAGIQTTNAGSAFVRHRHHDGEGQVIVSRLERETAGELTEWLPRTATLCRQTFAATVVKRSTYETLGGFAPAAGSAFDWEMWQRAAAAYPVWYEPTVLANTRKDGTTVSDTLHQSGQHIRDGLQAIALAQTYLPPTLARSLRLQANKRYAEFALWTARQALDRNDYAAALANVRVSLEAHRDDSTLQRVSKLLQRL